MALGQLREVEDRVTLGFHAGMQVALLGAPARGALGASEWLTSKVGEVTGEPVGIDLAAEARLQKLLIELARKRVLGSAHDVSDGGIGVCLAESCLATGVGCTIELGLSSGRELAKLFSEEPSRAVIAYAPQHEPSVRAAAQAADVPFAVIGTTGGDRLRIDRVVDLGVVELANAHRRALECIVGPE